MATTGRISRAFYPRWMTSSRPGEVTASGAIPDEVSEDRSVIAVLTSPDMVPRDESSAAGSSSISRLRDLLRSRVTKASKQIISSQTSSRRLIEQTHCVYPAQGFAEAMSECHSSVNQYYGVSENQSERVIEPNETKTSKRTANIASKKAKIIEAKQNRLSNGETQRRMKSLTINALAPGISVVSRITRLRELCDHAKIHPISRLVAINHGVVSFLLSLQAENERLKEKGLADYKKLCGVINESLAVLGHSPRIKSKGIKILSIDGGGTSLTRISHNELVQACGPNCLRAGAKFGRRTNLEFFLVTFPKGLVAIETLKQLEILCRAPIHTLFDYICGVSTGGLLAVLVGPMKLSLDRCEAVYKECSQRIFNRGTLAGAANLLTRHCFYDMSVWEGILKDELGAERTMVSTARDGNAPHIGLISTVMGELPYNYVFRNYNHDSSAPSQYPGTCDARVWEAIRASSAAPGYFEDFKLGQLIHQDGGVLNNNPTAIAIHEARALWPGEEVQCIVSVGNGRYEPESANTVQDVTSLRHKVGTFIHSATNTEDVHTVLNDLLPAETYYRFNPYMSEEFLLNEVQDEKLQQMQFDTQLYLRRNAGKVNKAGQQLRLGRTSWQKMHDWAQNKFSILSEPKLVN